MNDDLASATSSLAMTGFCMASWVAFLAALGVKKLEDPGASQGTYPARIGRQLGTHAATPLTSHSTSDLVSTSVTVTTPSKLSNTCIAMHIVSYVLSKAIWVAAIMEGCHLN